ncbi:MAG: prephenate dehydrogenase/arogenate dehydrogenase family protein [Candidatus Ancillula sp.]|jgi:prephenate dehydrogenase/8-oxo-dGTP pyrophosphatase MutT (NUDIX family)|nr:prephenate dehydrogenase/arogenate dehydrogenase family protein [Candidatus Ancillula sp.]
MLIPRTKIKVAILGLGLIGGSIAKRLITARSLANLIDVYAWNHNSKPYKAAQELGIETVESLYELVDLQLDYIFVAVPISAVDEIFQQLGEIFASSTGKKPTITDVASVKVSMENLARKYNIGDFYVGSHPLFGTEFTGFDNSKAQMGDGKAWAVCVNSSVNSTDQERVVELGKFIEEHLAGKPIFCSAQEHDKAIAISSHIPHVFAYELAGLISEKATENDLAKQLNADSFHGATRVAHGNTALFEGMLQFNKEEIVNALQVVIKDLSELAENLTSKNKTRTSKSIHHFIHRSSSFRDIDNKPDKKLHAHNADGWVKCGCGKEHWGLNGAAGLFLLRSDPSTFKTTHILLQHRALWSAEGGTWGTIGGALDFGEDAKAGALREAQEEGGIQPDQVHILGSIKRSHPNWSYTTVFGIEIENGAVLPQVQDCESIEIRWVEVNEIRTLPLLSAFGNELDELLTIANDLLIEYKKEH